VTWPTVRLEADGLDPLDLSDESGWFGVVLDVGDPTTREVVEDAPDADGTIDSTSLIGSRPVTLQVVAFPEVESLWTMRQRLKAFTDPRRRPIMYVQFDPAAPRQRVMLRRSRLTDPYRWDETADLVVSWVAPYGILESAEHHAAVAAASGDGTDSGLVAPIVAPFSLNASAVAGAVEVVNAGTAHAYPVIRLYGPSTAGGELVNDATGLALVFGSGFDIDAGDFVEIDFRAKTIRYNADPADSRYDGLEFGVSRWWTLQPGAQRIRWAPATFTPPAQAVIYWRDAWL
jgi:hypothetical protein